MGDEVLKSCKKYVIKSVINPSLYWMIEYEKDKCYKKKREGFEYLLAGDVEIYTGTRKIFVGELIAIKHERGFLRGLVMDIYNRNTETEYRVLLVDNGNTIDIKQRNVYFIKNKELRNKNLSVVKVSVNGIQPAAMEMQYENNFLGGIFQKRFCQNWSAGAFQFVMDLVLKNPWVFVKPVLNDKSIISGEVYFLQEPDGVPVGLGQMLCIKGFAMLCDSRPKLMIQDDMKGGSDYDIEKKIPGAALFREKQNDEVERKYILKNVENDGNKVRDLVHCNSSSDSYSSSWILKKCLHNFLIPSSSCEAFKQEDIYETERTNCSSPENAKFSIFRVIKRSMEFFDKEKQRETFCNN